MIFNKIKKMFTGGEWGIAFKNTNRSDYQIIDMPKGTWAADPMLFEHKGVHYLFAEIYEKRKKKASIGYFIFENDVPVFKGIIIENEYHMSYPCVFEFENNIYMIPESSANKSLDLYKAIDFPSKWEKNCVLITDCSYVDTTVYCKNGLYFLTYERFKKGWVLKQFNLDVLNKTVSELSSHYFESNVGRPAGYLIKSCDSFVRPAQDCSNKYGESIIFYDIKSFNPYEEEFSNKLSIYDVMLPIRAQRIHTYCENSKFCVLDYFVEKFELFHALEILKRSHYKKRDLDKND